MNDFFEKTLEEIVFDNREFVQNRGFVKFYKNAQRQFRLPNGKKIDILTWEMDGYHIRAKIIELKREVITGAAYFQALGYYSDLLSYIIGHFRTFDIDVVLVGTNISEDVSLAIHASNMVVGIKYRYDFDGIMFYPSINTFNNIKEVFPTLTTTEESDEFIAKLSGFEQEEVSSLDLKIV